MGRYPAEPLEDKLVWMRAKQERRRQREARRIEPHRTTPPPSDPPLLPKMLRVKQVAGALGVSETTVRAWFTARAVIVKSPQSKRKSVMLIPQRAFDDWLREHGPSSR